MGCKGTVTEVWIKKQNKQTKPTTQQKRLNQLQEYICSIKISQSPGPWQ